MYFNNYNFFIRKFWLEYFDYKFELKRFEFYIFIIFGIQIIEITIAHYCNFPIPFYFTPKIKLRSIFPIVFTIIHTSKFI